MPVSPGCSSRRSRSCTHKAAGDEAGLLLGDDGPTSGRSEFLKWVECTHWLLAECDPGIGGSSTRQALPKQRVSFDVERPARRAEGPSVEATRHGFPVTGSSSREFRESPSVAGTKVFLASFVAEWAAGGL